MKKSELPDALEVLKNICALIIEVRTANKESERGREEGVHCKAVFQEGVKHECDTENNPQCQYISQQYDQLSPFLSLSDSMITIDTIISRVSHDTQAALVSVGDKELLLERWEIRTEQDSGQRVGQARLLLQAIHSHLHFSQLSAWLSSSKGHFPANISFRINCVKKMKFKSTPDEHRFPIIGLENDSCMVVMAYSLPRCTLHITETDKQRPKFGSPPSKKDQIEPKTKPLTSPLSAASIASCSHAMKLRMIEESKLSVPVSSGPGETCLLYPVNNSFRKYHQDSGIFSANSSFTSPSRLSRSDTFTRSPPSPVFFVGDDSSMDSDIFPSAPISISPTPYNSPQHSIPDHVTTPLRSTPYPYPISEIFTLTPPKVKQNGITTKPLVLASTPSSSRSSGDLDLLSFSPIKFESPMKHRLFAPAQRRSSSLCIDETEDEFDEKSSLPGCVTIDDMRSSWHGNPFFDKPSFKRSTSLPLLSSPIANRKSCCRNDRKILGQTVLNTNRNCLLGNFEENILKDRFTPSGSISGFKYKMSVSGQFSAPSITLPFTGNFYNLSDRHCPSPYTGCVKLDTCGTNGYLIPRHGRIQATVLDPENCVIRIFLVPYDVRDMPARSQTFIRQRIHAVSAAGAKSLQYHIHFRIMTGRTSRVYLHTEIRVLFVRGGASSLDADPGGIFGNSSTLTTENCIPSNPRYSTIGKTKRAS